MLINILSIIQIVSAVLLVIVVLLQQQGAGLGAGFGSSGGGIQTTRRGPEKLLFQTTIAISIIFFGVSLAIVII